MARTIQPFKLLVLNDSEILQYLYSVAYARAALEDIRIVAERNQFDIPGEIGNATRIDSAAGNPFAVKMRALQYYDMYVQGFHNRQAQSVEELGKFLFAIAERKEQYQQGISRLQASVDRHNKELLEFFTAAAHIAIKTRTFGTVVMAGAATVAAVGGAAAAAPLALIYLGYKVVGGFGASVADGKSAWSSAVGVALGKYDNGVITVGEGAQPVVDKTLEGLSKAYGSHVAIQITSKSKSVAQLENQVAAQTRALARQTWAGNKAASARTLQSLRSSSAALTAEQQAAGRMVRSGIAKSAAAQAFRKGMPIISFTNDMISAYGDYFEDEAKLESRR